MRKISLVVICLVLSARYAGGQVKLGATKIGSRIEVNIGGALFTNYIFSAEEKYPFFFPLNGPSGASVTSMRNGNYPHHSSVFFGSDLVNGGNYWQEGLDRGQIVSLSAEIVKNGPDTVVIRNECIWKRPGAQAPIKDLRKITITAPSKELYQLDFDITLEALLDITIQKTNHSLFSIRVDPDIAVINGGTMLNAEGKKSEKGTFGEPSAWIDCYGARQGKVEGVAILQHPSNYGYPYKWFTRDYGFFSPTPLFWPQDGKTTKFAKGDATTLRFRTLVHTGDAATAKIKEQFQKYSQE
ncbi:MAG: PmoA family protein [Bacteroidales bacterium]|jgi:hypothetical protein|nr:PmoA family protein [Bacteroidales bacterium]